MGIFAFKQHLNNFTESFRFMKRMSVIAAIAVTTIMGVSGQVNSTSADGYLSRGKMMYQDRNYAGCIDQLEHLDRLPVTPAQAEEAAYFRAMAAVACCDSDAEALLQRYLADYPASVRRADVMMATGDVEFFKGDYAGALKKYAEVESDCLNEARAEDLCYRRSYCRLMLADYDEAEAGFKSLSHTARYGNAARFYEGYIAYCRQDYGRAKTLFEGVDRTKAPGNMTDYYLSQIYFMDGDYDTALTMSRRLLATDVEPHFRAEANRIAGESLYNLGQETQAIPYLKQYAGAVETPQPSTMYILGVNEYNSGNYAEAVKLLGNATECDNAMGQSAYLYIGQSYMKEGNNSAAMMAFGQASRMNFDRDVTETALYNYAVAKSEGGRVPFGSSVTAFEEFLSRYPESRYAPEVQEYVIAGYMTDNNYESALRSIEKINNPGEAVLKAKQRVLFTLGTRDLAAGKVQTALSRFQQARQLSAYDAEIARDCNLWIGDCYYRQGKYGSASQAYVAYINSAPVGDANRTLAYYNLGYSRFGEKKYGDAITDFNRVIKAKGNGNKAMLADAYNRVGDCYYYDSQFDRAAANYDKAYELNPSAGDYALYQKAIMKGLSRNYKGEISTLDEVIEKFPSSGLVPSALLAKAESYIALGDNRSAIETYRELVAKHPSTAQGRNGHLQLAITYMNEGNSNKSIETYKEVISSYPTSEEARVASDDLKRIYADAGKLQEYAKFISTVPNAPQLEASEMDALTFHAAEKAYIDGENTSKMEKYVEQFPDGKYEAQALYYLATSAQSAGKDNAALKYATRLIEEHPDAEAVEDALAIKADVEYRQGKGELALETYRQLEQRASASRNMNAARLGIMRVSRALGKHDDVVEAADRLMASSTVGASEINEIRFARAYSLNELGRSDEAVKEWTALAGDTSDLYGAKSAYYLSQYYYDSGDMAKARKSVDEFINSNPPHQYWLARGFILLSDINRKEGNDFEADEYLKSLRSNYPGTESDIFQMIDQRLK